MGDSGLMWVWNWNFVRYVNILAPSSILSVQSNGSSLLITVMMYITIWPSKSSYFYCTLHELTVWSYNTRYPVALNSHVDGLNSSWLCNNTVLMSFRKLHGIRVAVLESLARWTRAIIRWIHVWTTGKEGHRFREAEDWLVEIVRSPVSCNAQTVPLRGLEHSKNGEDEIVVRTKGHFE